MLGGGCSGQASVALHGTNPCLVVFSGLLVSGFLGFWVGVLTVRFCVVCRAVLRRRMALLRRMGGSCTEYLAGHKVRREGWSVCY